LLVFVLIFLTGCNLPLFSEESRQTATAFAATATAQAWTVTPSPTFTLTPSLTPSFTPSLTPSITPSPTATQTPSITPTFTASPSPTFALPQVVVNQQSYCRYGPARAFLPAGDLYKGDTGLVWGRYQYSQWLLIKLDKLHYPCWVAPSVIDITGDVSRITFTEPRLPGPSVLYEPPRNVRVAREGTQVTITWEMVNMTEDDDRGYMVDLWVCQNGAFIWWTASLSNKYQTTYTVTDEAGCAGTSGGVLYAVEKHGYVRPVTLNWPKP
jgi:hypothetical protein